MTFDFKKLLEWKLLAGSHAWPGPDGGTCINEMAMVVNGFQYKSIRRADEMPPCFSRKISAFAMTLNDSLPEDERQRLAPYVLRLAGTADVLAIENYRGLMIKEKLLRGMDEILDHNEMESSFCRSRYDQHKMSGTNPAMILKDLLYDLNVEKMLTIFTLGNPKPIIHQLANLGFEVLDLILSIGNQAQPLDVNVANERIIKAKEKAKKTVVV